VVQTNGASFLKKATSLVKGADLLKWVGDFIEAHSLAGDHKKVVCALSGGPDSMLLSHICEGLVQSGFLKSVRHVHIDHGLRPESGAEAFKLKGWAKEWGWDFSLQKVTSNAPESNIEAWARRVRRHLLLGHLKKDEVLFLAHHIDDSFEWFLRQTLGSSQGTYNHGIPLINGKVRRPLHCLSRQQIERFIRQNSIPTIIDASNLERRFQRNQIRQDVKGPLLSLFPKGLAHYVERSNQWALKEGVDRPSKKSQQKKNKLKVKEYSLSKNVICLTLKDEGRWEEARAYVLAALKKCSRAKRGSLRQNLNKLFETLKTGQKRGPLSFSGGVEIFIYPGTLIFINEQGHRELADFLKKSIKSISASQIPKASIKKLKKDAKSSPSLPFVIFRRKTFGLTGLKSDPLFQEVIDWAGSEGLYFRPLRHMELVALKQGRLDQKFPSVVLK
jgi:tRNA(Ile)-lysidine synthase